MDNRYYIEIIALDKVAEILDTFKEYNPHIFSKTDEGYEWLEEDDSKCIVLDNPHYEETLEIVVGDMGEFMLFFAKSHAHYSNYQLDYEQMIERIKGILTNNFCAGVITDNEGNWFGSAFFDKDDIKKAPQSTFDFVFKEKEFADKLLSKGYKVEYSFWNPIDNSVING